MKPKYLLQCYEKLLRSINNPAYINEKKCIEAIQKITSESFVTYRIIFTKQKNTTTYQIDYPIHNLHPHAPGLKQLKQDSHPELEKYIPKIIKELNLQEPSRCWSSDDSNIILYLSVDVGLERLSSSNLLLIYYYQMAKHENKKIRNNCKNQVFMSTSTDQIELFIRKVQSGVNSLLDRTITEMAPASVQDIYLFSNQYQKSDYLKITYLHLEKLLRFLEKDYMQYIDPNRTVPFLHRVRENEVQLQKIQIVKEALTERCENQKLLKIALLPIDKISAIELNAKITYAELRYCKKYIGLCYDFFHLHLSTSELDICQLLINGNLNSLQLFEYKVDDIISNLNQQESIRDKINLLLETRKNLNQNPTAIIKPLFSDYPPIKTQIIGWIEEEIEFLKCTINLNNISQTIPADISPKTKMQTELSVAQLSYLFNLLHQSGVIKQSNQRDIFRFIAENFKTKTTEQISVDSIKSRYYNVESSTKSAVREKIIHLLNLAKS